MNKLYQTTDMNLAAVLSIDFPLKEIINKNGRGIFIFEDSDELQELAKSYWNRLLTIEPQALFDALKTIKNRLYNEIKENL